MISAEGGDCNPPGALEPLIVAFSGGGDSTALLHWAVLQRAGLAGNAPPVALIIDHRMRPGSADSAALAARRAADLGAAPVVVALDPPPRSQAGARNGRYRALAEVARVQRAHSVLLGHTADDQAETVFMRLSRGSGAEGLAGMAPAAPLPLWPEGRGLFILRPLLVHSRAELRAHLSGLGLPWMDDPANAQPRFARVRARAALDAAPEVKPAMLRMAAEAGIAAAHVQRQAKRVIAGAQIAADGRIFLDRTALLAAPAPVQWRSLAALLAAAAGASRAPAPLFVSRLADALGRRDFAGATLFGAAIKAKGAVLVFGRDPGAVLGRGKAAAPAAQSLPLSAPVVWDGRFAIQARAAGWSIQADPRCAPILVKGRETVRVDSPEVLDIADIRPLAAERLDQLFWRANPFRLASTLF